MVVPTKPETIIPADIFVPAYGLVRGVEDKIKATYLDAEFQLLCGPDEALHLKVYSSAPSMWDVMDLVRDDLLELREKAGIFLFVLPVRHEDREGNEPTFGANGNNQP